MENCTNCSEWLEDADLAGPVFGGFIIISFLLNLFAFVLITTAGVILLRVNSVAKILRVFLISLLLAELIVVVFNIANCLLGVVLNFSSLSPPGLPLCRFFVWGYVTGTFARLYNLAVFSVVVLLMVRYHRRKFHPVYVIVSLIFTWTVPILLNIYVITPPIYAVQYFDSVACFPAVINTHVILEVRYTFTAISCIFGGIFPVVISIVAPIIGLCYIRTLVAESAYNKAITTLTFFLVVGHVNIIGQYAVGVFTSYSAVSGVYVVYTLSTVSVISTPIFIMLYLEQVRSQLKKLLFCRLFHAPRKVSSNSIQIVMNYGYPSDN